MIAANATPSKQRKDSEVLKELLQHNACTDLSQASPELQALVCQRWQNCEAFECCKADGFHVFYCDCRNVLKRKLEWKPTHPSLAQKRRREKQFWEAVRYVAKRVANDGERKIADAHIMKYRFKYDVDLMHEARSIVQQLKQEQHDDAKNQGR